MKDKKTKLFKAMMLGALAMFIMSAHRASAAESVIYKCANPKGEVAFQDFACADGEIMDQIKIDINQSADIAPALRPLEQQMLTQSFKRLQLERILAAKVCPFAKRDK